MECESQQCITDDVTDFTAVIAGCRESVTQLLHHTTSLFYTTQYSDLSPYIIRRASLACRAVFGDVMCIHIRE